MRKLLTFTESKVKEVLSHLHCKCTQPTPTTNTKSKPDIAIQNRFPCYSKFSTCCHCSTSEKQVWCVTQVTT